MPLALPWTETDRQIGDISETAAIIEYQTRMPKVTGQS